MPPRLVGRPGLGGRGPRGQPPQPAWPPSPEAEAAVGAGSTGHGRGRPGPGPSRRAWPGRPTLVVPSPGVPVGHPALVAAMAAGIEVVSEIELAWQVLDAARQDGDRPGRAVIPPGGHHRHQRQDHGHRSGHGHVGGLRPEGRRRRQRGLPAARGRGRLTRPPSRSGAGPAPTVAKLPPSCWWPRCRRSSSSSPRVPSRRQLLAQFRPRPPGLAPGPRPLRRAKAKIWANQGPGSVAVVNADDPVVLGRAATVPGRRRVVTFGAAGTCGRLGARTDRTRARAACVRQGCRPAPGLPARPGQHCRPPRPWPWPPGLTRGVPIGGPHHPGAAAPGATGGRGGWRRLVRRFQSHHAGRRAGRSVAASPRWCSSPEGATRASIFPPWPPLSPRCGPWWPSARPRRGGRRLRRPGAGPAGVVDGRGGRDSRRGLAGRGRRRRAVPRVRQFRLVLVLCRAGRAFRRAGEG